MNILSLECTDKFDRTIEAYDPTSDRWTKIKPMLQPRPRIGVGVCNGEIYAVGGVYDRRHSNM